MQPKTGQVVISSLQSESSVLELVSETIVGVYMPSAWDAADIGFSSITRSKPTAFQAVSFKQFWMRMGGWKNIGEERIRSTTSNITSYGSRSSATRCYGAGWQSGCGI